MGDDNLALILSLAQAAIHARDDRTAWRKNVSRAAEVHGAACAALWDELERQIVIADGRVPTAEHPSVKYQRMIANMRSEIVNVALSAIEGSLVELAKGPALGCDE